LISLQFIDCSLPFRPARTFADISGRSFQRQTAAVAKCDQLKTDDGDFPCGLFGLRIVNDKGRYHSQLQGYSAALGHRKLKNEELHSDVPSLPSHRVHRRGFARLCAASSGYQWLPAISASRPFGVWHGQ